MAMYSFAGLAEYAVVPATAAFLLPPRLQEQGVASAGWVGWAWGGAICFERESVFWFCFLLGGFVLCVI